MDELLEICKRHEITTWELFTFITHGLETKLELEDDERAYLILEDVNKASWRVLDTKPWEG